MAFIVEIFRDETVREKGVDFSLHYKIWEELLTLAKEEGWEAKGTKKTANFPTEHFKNNYSPEYPYAKIIEKDDALNFAHSLEKLIPKMKTRNPFSNKKNPQLLRGESPLNDEIVLSSSISIELLQELINYMKQGEFEFWWDD
jgi:hypothetical protein